MSIEEILGEGNGPRTSAISRIIGEKKAELKPLADDLTDAYQATLVAAATPYLEDGELDWKRSDEHRGWLMSDVLNDHRVSISFDPSSQEYALKFFHYDDDFRQHESVSEHNKIPLFAEHSLAGSAAADAGATLGRTPEILAAIPETIRHEDHGNDWKDPTDDSVSKPCYQQYNSTSLMDLINFVNSKLLHPAHQIDASKYVGPQTGTDPIAR